MFSNKELDIEGTVDCSSCGKIAISSVSGAGVSECEDVVGADGWLLLDSFLGAGIGGTYCIDCCRGLLNSFCQRWNRL